MLRVLAVTPSAATLPVAPEFWEGAWRRGGVEVGGGGRGGGGLGEGELSDSLPCGVEFRVY